MKLCEYIVPILDILSTTPKLNNIIYFLLFSILYSTRRTFISDYSRNQIGMAFLDKKNKGMILMKNRGINSQELTHSFGSL